MSGTVSSSAVAITSANNINHHILSEKKRFLCEQYIQEFDSKVATIEASKEYAECINLLYSNEVNFEGGKGLVSIILILFFIGFLFPRLFDFDGDIVERIFSGVFMIFFSFIFFVIVNAIIYVLN